VCGYICVGCGVFECVVLGGVDVQDNSYIDLHEQYIAFT